jgi:hypothetical protein
LTLSLTGSEIASLFNFTDGLTSSTDASGVSVGMKQVNFYEPFLLPNTNSTLSAPGIGTWYFEPFLLPFGIAGGAINMFVSNAAGFLNGAVFSSANTGSASKIQSLSNMVAIYSRGAGANSTRLESVWTGVCELRATQSLSCISTTAGGGTTTGCIITNALTLSYPVSVGTDGVMTYSTTSQSGSTSGATSTLASTFANNLITGAVAYVSGARMDVIGLNTTIRPGQYWLAHEFSSNSSSSGTRYTAGTMFSTQSRIGLLENALSAYRGIGNSVSNTVSNAIPFKGQLNTTTSAATANAANGDIRYTTGRMYWNYDGDAYP